MHDNAAKLNETMTKPRRNHDETTCIFPLIWRNHFSTEIKILPYHIIIVLYPPVSSVWRKNSSGFVMVSSWFRRGFNKSAWVVPTARRTYLCRPRSKSAASKRVPFLPPNFSPGCQARGSSIPSNNKKQLEPPLYGPLTKPNAMLRHSHVNINTTLKGVGGMA